MLAGLGLRYGSDDAIDFSVEVHKTLAIEAYRSSVEVAKERVPLPSMIPTSKRTILLFCGLKIEDEAMYRDMVKHGRRNIALLTIAPPARPV